MDSHAFDGYFLAGKEREIFALVDCHPLGRTRINIGTTALEVQIEFSEPNSDSKSTATTHTKLDPEIAEKAFSAMEPLWGHWSEIWQIIYDGLVEVRSDYGCEEAITADNAKIKIFPPGDYIDYKSDNWSCSLEIEPWDGSFSVDFALDGTIVDSAATF